MRDNELITLLTNRQETAVLEVEKEYGKYLHSIAIRILRSAEDSKECVNDTLLKTWETIPPQKPISLKAYLGTIVRNISLDYYRKEHRNKRNTDLLEILVECEQCNPHYSENPEVRVEMKDLSTSISRYLEKMSDEKQYFFIARYYYGYTVPELAKEQNVSEGKVKMLLLRMRKDLKKQLEKEGVWR